LNGVVVTPTAPITYPDNNWIIGILGSDADGENFYGNMGNTAIYLNQTLTQEQVNSHYTAGITGYKYPL
jgi:hypothetical protein